VRVWSERPLDGNAVGNPNERPRFTKAPSTCFCEHPSAAVKADREGQFMLHCMSPLLAQSGHPDALNQCPLLGVKRTLSGGRFSFICAPSALRGLVGERAFHLLLNALNGPAADTTFAGNPQDAFAGTQLSLDALFDGEIDPRPTELLALR
jgi:hypothetical protein